MPWIFSKDFAGLSTAPSPVALPPLGSSLDCSAPLPESRERNCCAPQVHASSLNTAAAKQANSTTYGLGFVAVLANTARPP